MTGLFYQSCDRRSGAAALILFLLVYCAALALIVAPAQIMTLLGSGLQENTE